MENSLKNKKIIYETVLHAQQSVIDQMKPGVLWIDMHTLAYKVICTDLKKYGLLHGEVNDMMSANIGSIFMPHGLGHLLGIDTHDVGAFPNGIQKPSIAGYSSLRMTRELEEGMTITVEPGIYFIDHLLNNAFKDPQQSKFLVPDKINEYRGFGGVRIEDDVIVTKSGIHNMTTAPKTVAEIESFMANNH